MLSVLPMAVAGWPSSCGTKELTLVKLTSYAEYDWRCKKRMAKYRHEYSRNAKRSK